jgi:hypothetical protein
VLLVNNLPVGTLRTWSYGQFYLNYHPDYARRHPFPPGMINNYYNHSSMALIFLPFFSMLIPRSYELETMSEEERRTREQNELVEKDDEEEEDPKHPPRDV